MTSGEFYWFTNGFALGMAFLGLLVHFGFRRHRARIEAAARPTAPAAVPPSGERTEAAATGGGKETGARRNQRLPGREESPS